jgi:hypothetical protein
MEYKFVESNVERKFQFVGERKAGPTKKLREDLADTLIWLASEWSQDGTTLTEAKEIVLGCIEQTKEEGGKPEEVLRMRNNVESIDSLGELVKYIYNFKLRSSGLSVHRVMRSK